MTDTEDSNKLPPGWHGPDVELTGDRLVLVATSPAWYGPAGHKYVAAVGGGGSWGWACALARLADLAAGAERARALDEQIRGNGGTRA